jgi:hypothetical protein
VAVLSRCRPIVIDAPNDGVVYATASDESGAVNRVELSPKRLPDASPKVSYGPAADAQMYRFRRSRRAAPALDRGGRRAAERFISLSRQRSISVSQRFISLSSHTAALADRDLMLDNVRYVNLYVHRPAPCCEPAGLVVGRRVVETGTN